MVHVAKDMDIRLAGGRTAKEGRIEMKFDDGPWGVACGDGWGVREAMVACKQLGLGYAAATMSTSIFGGSNMTKLVSGLGCKGNEESLLDCGHDDFGSLLSWEWLCLALTLLDLPLLLLLLLPQSPRHLIRSSIGDIFINHRS